MKHLKQDLPAFFLPLTHQAAFLHFVPESIVEKKKTIFIHLVMYFSGLKDNNVALHFNILGLNCQKQNKKQKELKWAIMKWQIK